MRLQKINSYYPVYLKQFYGRRPQLAAETYATQHAALMSDCVGLSDFWTEALNKLGYETNEIVSNAELLQKRWAAENRAKFDEENWVFDIVAAQVKAFRPEVLVFTDYTTFNAQFLRELRAESHSIRLVLGWCGGPYEDASVFDAYDIVLSCVPELVERFRLMGHRCAHINHAFEPRILERINTLAAPSVNFSFLGSIVKGNNCHNERERLLLELIKHTELELWLDVHQLSAQARRGVRARQLAYDAVRAAKRVGVPQTILKGAPLLGKVPNWEARPLLPPAIDRTLAQRAHTPLYGLEMYQKLRASRVALNTHIDISSTNASNMRLFEATGVGTCLLTDWKENLGELFEPEQEVVSYKNAEECIEKVRYLLEHEDERKKIAAAGQRRTLRDHTHLHRAEQIAELIKDYLSQTTI